MELIIIGIVKIVALIFLYLVILSILEKFLPYHPLMRYSIAIITIGSSILMYLLFDKESKEEIEAERWAKTIEFVVEKKEKVSNFLYDDYYLISNKGIISVDKIDYYNFDKLDTLIIKEKELNKSANILEYTKVKK